MSTTTKRSAQAGRAALFGPPGSPARPTWADDDTCGSCRFFVDDDCRHPDCANYEHDDGAGRVCRAWPLIRQQAERQSVRLYTALRFAQVRAAGDQVFVVLPTLELLHRASSPAMSELLEAIIARVTGDRPELRFVMEEFTL